MTNAEKLRRWRAANPEMVKAQKSRSYKNHVEKNREYARNYQATRRATDLEGARAYARLRYRITMTPKKRLAETLRLRKYADPTQSRQRALLRKYGLTIQQWEAILASQNYCCACCGTDRPGSRWGWSTDHKPGSYPVEVRGILCLACNVSLGRLGDEVGLNRALAYVHKTSAGFGTSEGLLY